MALLIDRVEREEGQNTNQPNLLHVEHMIFRELMVLFYEMPDALNRMRDLDLRNFNHQRCKHQTKIRLVLLFTNYINFNLYVSFFCL